METDKKSQGAITYVVALMTINTFLLVICGFFFNEKINLINRMERHQTIQDQERAIDHEKINQLVQSMTEMKAEMTRLTGNQEAIFRYLNDERLNSKSQTGP